MAIFVTEILKGCNGLYEVKHEKELIMKKLSILAGVLILLVGCTPIRVGTKGAKYYHMPDCPAVQRSWAKGGERVNFYTWGQIHRSERVPDSKECESAAQSE